MVKVKFTKRTFVEGVQYGAGDVDVFSEDDGLCLYKIGDAIPHLGNLDYKKFDLSKVNHFLSVHGKKNLGRLMCVL